MKEFKLFLWLTLLVQSTWLSISNAVAVQSGKTQSSVVQLYDTNRREVTPTGESTLGALYRKSRQSRCVRCYEDRYGDDRGRYSGGYSGRSSDDRSSWYYPYDRYDDRTRNDYDRYSSSYYRDRDDRMGSRSYDRYEGRGYDRYDRRGSYDQDRYSSDSYYRDRYYDRPRTYDRDYYDRYYNRYDYRNYRPLDETYRGQSGFDNSGRGYYFATPSQDRRYLPRNEQRTSPCGFQVRDCQYGGTAQVTSRPIGSNSWSGNGYGHGSGSGSGSGYGGGRPGSSGWTYINEQDQEQEDQRGGSNNKNNNNNSNNQNSQDNNNSNNNKNNNNNSSNNSNDRDRNRDRGGERDRVANDRDRGNNDNNVRDRDPQSTSYGGRPPRPLGGSYLFDRDSNAVADGKTATDTADAAKRTNDAGGDGGMENGSSSGGNTSNAAAQMASQVGGANTQLNANDKQ